MPLPQILIALVPGLPLAMAALLAFAPARAAVRAVLPLAALPALALTLLPDSALLAEPWLMLGGQFGTDPVGRVFMGFSALIWAAAGWAAVGWMRGDDHATGFAACFLLAMAGNLGMFTARDVASLYALFALMSFASYGLVVHGRSGSAFAAGRIYIVFVVAGELALFAGLALMAANAGSLMLADLRAAPVSDIAAGLLLAGFAVKLGIMPLHVWLPPAHGAAPVPASAVLSGAMIKAGLFGMIAVMPFGVAEMPVHGTVLMAAGLVTIFAAGLGGVNSDSPKAVLGWSSVSQMGLMALGLGAALTVPGAWALVLPALMFQAAHHGLAKGALFLGTGAFGAAAALRGSWAALPLLALPMAALVGLAPLSGYAAKEGLRAALAAGPAGWVPWLVLALTLSGLVTTLLMGRYLLTLWRQVPTVPRAVVEGPGWVALPAATLAACGVLLLGLWPLAGFGPVPSSWPKDWLTQWPVAAGVVLSVAGAIWGHAQRVGPLVLLAQVMAPWHAAEAYGQHKVRMTQRAARRLARAIPAHIDAVAARWRLGQAAMAAVLVALLAVEAPALFSQIAEHAPFAAAGPDLPQP
ncbi:complex I subunit 5 family protein [Meridianimarinicoccus sp. RP-17]|uniref:complex I subunit 5 family protein n=1 Tax=Meridianimarinicoccus zhengii TaxID=2056810 RepID=UPI0013A6CCC2|nr:proton-conducting transporter membrane subunit [Phycocomes zhengii]